MDNDNNMNLKHKCKDTQTANMHIFTKLVQNKVLPLSESDTLHILEYNRIATVIVKEMPNCLTITNTILLTMIEKSYTTIISHYSHHIVNSKSNTNADTNKFITALITYNNLELLRNYAYNHNYAYCISDLEFACDCIPMNLHIIFEIINSGVLPTNKCITTIASKIDPQKKHSMVAALTNIIPQKIESNTQ